MNPDPIDAASERDRIFFERHPHQTCCIRPAITGEMPGLNTPPDGWLMVAVQQIQPGVRMRAPFIGAEILRDSDPTARIIATALIGDLDV